MKKLLCTAATLTLLSACAVNEAPMRDAPQPLQPAVGARWFKLPTEPYKGKQDDVFFVDAKLGFYVNGQGKIYRSRDGGASWQLVLNQPGTYFRAIAMLDERHGYAGNIGTDYFPGVTDENPLYETRDGGDSWQVVKGLPGAPVKGICAIDVINSRFINAGVLDQRTIVHAGGRVGSPAYLLRSLDGGKSWTNIDMSPWVAMIVDVKFFDEMNGIVFAGSDPETEKSHALIVATHDGGKTWRKVYESNRLFELTWKGSFPSRNVGYATIQNYNPDKAETQRRIVKTMDGGKSWTELPLVNDAAVREFGVGFANEQLGWVGTTKGGFETRDGGAHWAPVDLGRVVNKIRILPDGNSGFTGFAVGADLYKFGVPPVTATGAVDAQAVTVGKP
ncbi:WD40/YVTN/BNR-like repeat-containing protein [Chitinimonas sp.]|uniref:WD40/YVTN/BNR-like repeat-containing protein n=1 Tax=Chitinimonas sp. TaxID=1934313 RepID=UPI0035B0C396